MTSKLLIKYMPSGTQNLLVQASISPVDVARTAWRDWISERSLDDASWSEIRMLPSIASRATELQVEAMHIPRLDGIRRFVWAATQKKLLAARPALQLLTERGLSPMLLKGGAIIAGNLAGMSQRFLRDVDILVKPEYSAKAIRLMMATGWTNTSHPTPEEAIYLGLIGSRALQFLSTNGGEIDLHQYAMTPNPYRAMDEGMYARARTSNLMSVPCLCPSPEDLLVNTLEHSFRRDPDKVLDWSVDASRLIQSGQLDWDLVGNISEERCLSTPVEARLRYLREVCHLPDVPASILVRLRKAAEQGVFVDEYRSLQDGHMGLNGARLKARSRAADFRSRHLTKSRELAHHAIPPQAANELGVKHYLGGKRIDVQVPETGSGRIRLKLRYGKRFPKTLGCWIRAYCGAMTVLRLSGRRDAFSCAWRFLNANTHADPIWFAAQQTNTLTLLLDVRDLRKPKATVSPNGIRIECTPSLLKDGTVCIQVVVNAVASS